MSKTSLGQSNQLKMVRSFIGSNFNLSNQLSAKRLAMQFPIQTYINIMDQMNAIHIVEKYIKHSNQIKTDKQTYSGQTQNGKKQGFGTYIFKNYDSYTGYWDSDKMHSMGIYKYNNSNIDNFNNQKFAFMGQFSAGKFNGIGKLILLKNQKQGLVIYQGYWQHGLKNGYGVYFYGPDTSIYYEGYWQSDKKHGQGRLTFKNGQYSGYWSNDKRHGQGKLKIEQLQKTLIYEGQWNNDQLNQGQITYLTSSPDSIRQGNYKGKIKNFKRDGQGIFQYNNIYLKGIFDNDYFTGKGILYNDQYNLEGDFTSGKNIIKAKINYPNGDKFNGIVDISSGTIKRKQGKYQFKNGDSAQGKFDDQGSGAIKGFFEYLWSNGQTKKLNR